MVSRYELKAIICQSCTSAGPRETHLTISPMAAWIEFGVNV